MKPPLAQGRPDDFQTPPEALAPLLPYLHRDWVIWECAAGEGSLYCELLRQGYRATASDVIYDARQDFLSWSPPKYDCVVTNPPFSLKQEFLERVYALGKPFALLLPLTALETKKRQDLFKRFGIEIILFDKRVNFSVPGGKQQTGSWFATAWFTNGLNIGRELTFVPYSESTVLLGRCAHTISGEKV